MNKSVAHSIRDLTIFYSVSKKKTVPFRWQYKTRRLDAFKVFKDKTNGYPDIGALSLQSEYGEVKLGCPHATAPLGQVKLGQGVHTVRIRHDNFYIKEIQFLSAEGESTSGQSTKGGAWYEFIIPQGEDIIGIYGEYLKNFS